MNASAQAADLPPACQLVPIIPGESSPLFLAAVLQTQKENEAPHLILLSAPVGGRVYLGALADRGGRVREWVELWVQVTSGLHGSVGASEAGLTNSALDVRWRQMIAGLVSADPDACWNTGWETKHPRPVWLDAAGRQAVHAVDPGSARAYELCTDDTVLIASGLEPFSETLHRYLYAKDQAAAPFVAATAGAPRATGVCEAKDVLPKADRLVPFNPEGGLLFVRRLAPLELKQYADLLSGVPFSGLSAGRPPVKLRGPFAGLDDWDKAQQEGRYIFSQRRGRSGRFLETLHLKLQLFTGMLRAVQTTVAKQQAPILGLSTDSFRVGFAEPAGDLPVLWTASVALTDATSALSLPPAPDGTPLFRPVGPMSASPFRSARQSVTTRGRGELRVRAVKKEGPHVRVEATITASDLVACSVNDLICVRVPIPAGPAVELWGTISMADGLTKGEARFRSSTTQMGPDTYDGVARMEGAVLPRVPFDTFPLLSSPCDLFSLGAIGVQLFLAPGGEGLAVALDETLSLARALDANSSQSAGAQAKALAAGDSRWVRSLGPHHHGHGTATPEEAFSFVPLELWWDIVAFVARLFPGAGSMSYRRDLGDAPPQRIEAVFDQPITAAENLVFQSRSVLLGDWMSNREVAGVIQRMR